MDCGASSVETHPGKSMETIETIRLIKNELGLKTTLDVERISAGSLQRDGDPFVNTFLAMSLASGLDVPVLDTMSSYLIETVNAFRKLTGQTG